METVSSVARRTGMASFFAQPAETSSSMPLPLDVLPSDQKAYFESLREKWASNPNGDPSNAAFRSTAVVMPPTLDDGDTRSEVDLDAQRAALQRLDKIKLCNKCQGLGIVKQTYNFMVLEENCDECDGEGTRNLERERKILSMLGSGGTNSSTTQQQLRDGSCGDSGGVSAGCIQLEEGGGPSGSLGKQFRPSS